MDVGYINPFLSAVQNVFTTMIHLPFTLGKPTLDRCNTSPYEISSIIELSGEVIGCVVVSFPEVIALRLASILLDEEIKEVNGDCTDAIGEIANMIVGDAKKDFPKSNTSVSVPSVVIGEHKIAYPSGVPIISIPCETDDGRFAINIALKES